ncbi:hypothetical protein [Oceanicaulis sp.]|uniref:hypothetical protein n=1 Tax=Oceanicaulis sp. TaxID=1924941 RepID=UPI003BA9F0A8
MTLSASLLPALSLDRLRDAIRRSLPLTLAISVHLALLALLVRTPPAELLRITGVSEVLDVRFYTVSAPNADSDARLVEPPLAEIETDPAAAEPAPVTESAAVEPVPSEDPSADAPVDEALSPDEPVPGPAADTTDPAVPANTPANGSGSRTTGVGQPVAPATASANGPVATTQITPSPPRAPARLPSFADILARAETRLNPADFQIALSLNGVVGTVRESFCLSSSQANLEAGECPDGPNARSAELARFGLQALGEASPEFIEDMDRMAFQLRQLGANPAQVERIMLALSEARRDAIATPGVTRAMQRDQDARTDNLGNRLPDPD